MDDNIIKSVGDGFKDLDPRIAYFVKYSQKQNFGDYLPEIMCKELLTYPRIQADVYRLIGSVIEDHWIRRDLRRANGHLAGLIAFWCCGARGDTPLSPEVMRHCRFFGARGPLTRDVLGLPSDTILGDPGLLAPLFHAPVSHPGTTGRSICIPHIHDGRPLDALFGQSGAEVLVHPQIDAGETPMRDILDRIASADFVLTASLHGAIIACAYGRPFSFWDNGHLDVPFKWKDFALSVNIPMLFATNLSEGWKLWHREIQPSIRIPPLTAILDVAPFMARPEALLRAMGHDLGDPERFAEAAARIGGLASTRSDEIHALQKTSAQQRANGERLVFRAKRLAGLTAKMAKRSLMAS